MNWTKILVEIYCWFNGYTVKELTTKKELKASFDLKNRVNQELYELPPVPEKDEFVYPDEGVHFIGIFKKNEMVGSVHLTDLTKTDAYISKVFSTTKFTHNPLTTYEIKSLMVDLKHQDVSGFVFKVLMYYCMLFTEKTKRNKWVVVTRNTFYQLIKRTGLKVEMISKEAHFKKDDTVQSRYYQNYADIEALKTYCCYYIEIPKGSSANQMKRFFRKKIRKKLKPLRKLLQAQ